MIATKTPWPTDAIMIVAALAGRNAVSRLSNVIEDHCRGCHRLVHIDPRVMQMVEQHPCRGGRPIRSFCLDCARVHDLSNFNALHALTQQAS